MLVCQIVHITQFTCKDPVSTKTVTRKARKVLKFIFLAIILSLGDFKIVKKDQLMIWEIMFLQITTSSGLLIKILSIKVADLVGTSGMR